MSCVLITRNQLFDSHLLSFEDNFSRSDPNYIKLEDGWYKLSDVMEQIPGWYLAITDDRVKMPVWAFGLEDDDAPFIHATITSFGSVSYHAFFDGDLLWYDIGNVGDVAPLVYAFRLVEF